MADAPTSRPSVTAALYQQEAPLGAASTSRIPRHLSIELLVLALAALAAVAMIWAFATPLPSEPFLVVGGVLFMASVLVAIRLLLDPDSVRARQTDAMLQLSSQTLDIMQQGLTRPAAQRLCELLLPQTAAIAVALTDTDYILGYAGFQEQENPSGSIIRTQATRDTIADGQPRVLRSSDEIGFTHATLVKAAIIIPLQVGEQVVGTLKLYYRNPKRITETQKSIASGLGTLLSTQMAAVQLEEQRKLATSMELKMLQSQINPHFLFNTINTIASLIRTDPTKARGLLRDFAIFYRRTLEDSSERIMLSREFEQTMRYFSFELARFGDERLALYVGADEDLQDMLVPPFIIQPLVENAVRHAMPSEGKLTIMIEADVSGPDVLVAITDDGVGMDADTCGNIMHPESSTGMGIAVKNVHDRMHGFFGQRAQMVVESEQGVGTRVTLVFPDCATKAPAADLEEPAMASALEELEGLAEVDAARAERQGV